MRQVGVDLNDRNAVDSAIGACSMLLRSLTMGEKTRGQVAADFAAVCGCADCKTIVRKVNAIEAVLDSLSDMFSRPWTRKEAR